MPFAPPDTLHPITFPNGEAHKGTVFLRAAIDHPRWSVGDYSYASRNTPTEDWAGALAPYLYPHAPERLVIGRFCAVADGVTFITASANHRRDGFSTYPFAIFDDMDPTRPSMPSDFPDTVLGHDIWLGQGVRVLPGANIGTGSIIGTGAVVGGTIPPYSVVAGNPGRVIRRRFDPPTIERLLKIAWWDWPIEHILAAEAAISGADLTALEAAHPDRRAT